MKLIKESIDDIQYVTEATENGEKRLYIEGIFLVGDRVNKNKRLYRMDLLRAEVNRYTEEYINKNIAVGELGHPEDPKINPERLSHKIISLREDGNTFIGKALILSTPFGNIARNLINDGVTLGVSSRAVGNVVTTDEGYNVVTDMRIITPADIVLDPSAPGAFVQGIMENREWMMINGIFVEQDFEHVKSTIKKTPKRELENVMIKMFENFIRKL